MIWEKIIFQELLHIVMFTFLNLTFKALWQIYNHHHTEDIKYFQVYQKAMMEAREFPIYSPGNVFCFYYSTRSHGFLLGLWMRMVAIYHSFRSSVLYEIGDQGSNFLFRQNSLYLGWSLAKWVSTYSSSWMMVLLLS